MRVLDIFSGTGGWSQAFLDRGHDVLRMDNDPRFESVPHTEIVDVMKLDFIRNADVILASPPCDGFSVASIGKMWLRPGTPKHPTAARGMALLRQAIHLITEARPRWWWLENPRGMMRCMPILEPYARRTVTYCRYGETRMKPTDLWGDWPETWRPHPPCRNGDPCHERAPRGSPTGTQGIKGKASRAAIPYLLSLEVCLACEAAD